MYETYEMYDRLWSSKSKHRQLSGSLPSITWSYLNPVDVDWSLFPKTQTARTDNPKRALKHPLHRRRLANVLWKADLGWRDQYGHIPFTASYTATLPSHWFKQILGQNLFSAPRYTSTTPSLAFHPQSSRPPKLSPLPPRYRHLQPSRL